MIFGTRFSSLHHPLLDHLRWIAGAAGGGLKLLLAHFVLVLEALFGGHLLEALALFSLNQAADKLKHGYTNHNQCHNAQNNYHCNIHVIAPLVFQSHPSTDGLASRRFHPDSL